MQIDRSYRWWYVWVGVTLLSVVVLFFFTPEQPLRAYLSYFIMISTAVLFFTMPVKLSRNVETVGRATLWAVIVNSIVNSLSGKKKD